jgi:hypothetical protein
MVTSSSQAQFFEACPSDGAPPGRKSSQFCKEQKLGSERQVCTQVLFKMRRRHEMVQETCHFFHVDEASSFRAGTETEGVVQKQVHTG